MKRIILCNIPMKKDVATTVYESNDVAIPVSNKAFMYPINAFLAETLRKEDKIKAILLVKRDEDDYYINNAEVFKKEMSEICGAVGITPDFSVIETSFDESKTTHTQLMDKLIDSIDDDAHIFADITYGPKDLPIVVFSTLLFAENYLRCSVDNIIYGQAFFCNNKVVKSIICDMSPLYCLSSISNTINCNDPDKARIMIKTLLST